MGTNYGQIYQNTPQGGPLQLVQDPSLEFAPIPDASHTRNRRRSPPDSACLAGTRRVLIQNVLEWAEGDQFTESNHILWLCGPVGCGKSAISQAVAEDFHQRGRLVGSFFFFRGSGDRSKIGKLILTLAYQMSDAIPETKPAIDKVLESPLALRGVSPSQQFQRLICQPLQAVMTMSTNTIAHPSRGFTLSLKRVWKGSHGAEETQRPEPVYLIVIDGLDECDDREDVATLIDDLLAYFKRNPSIRLRVFIASRIEEHIRARIERAEVQIVNLHRSYHSDADIETVARHMFKEAAEYNLVVRSYGKEWPAKKDFRKLLRHANGSFVFVTMLLKYILCADSDDGLTPMERFTLALEMDPGLDGLYIQSLQRGQHIPYFEEVLSTIVLIYEPLPVSGLALLLDVPAPKIVNALIPLQSIVHVPGDDETKVTLFHTSLRDFLLDEQRSRAFSSIPLVKRRERLAFRSLKLNLTQPPVGDVAHPAFKYVHFRWAKHWSDTHGRDLLQIRQSLDSLLDFVRREIPWEGLPVHIASLFFPVACYSKRYGRRSMSIAEDTVELFHPHAEAVGSLLSAYCMAVYNPGVPVVKPDSAVQQCLVMHFMRFMMCGAYAPPPPNKLNYDAGKSYILENWARHLTLAIMDDKPDDNLFSFLHSCYLPVEDSKSRFKGSVRAGYLQGDLKLAAEAVNRKFPGTIPESALEVEDLELPHIYGLPTFYYDYVSSTDTAP